MEFDPDKLDVLPSFAKFINDRSKIFTFANSKNLSFEKYDIIVVGAGPIGAAMAIVLARAGRKVLIVERSWDKPDRIVGELMQPGGVKALENLGLADVFYGIDAVQVNGYYVEFCERNVYIPYNKNTQTGKSLKGVSFHHGDFLMNLRAACKMEPNLDCLEAEVDSLIKTPDEKIVIGVRIKDSKGSKNSEAYLDFELDSSSQNPEVQSQLDITAPLTVIADGIYSKFRQNNFTQKSRKPKLISHFVGFVLKHEKENPLPRPNNGHVFLSSFTPILMYQMSQTETRVLVDVPGTKLPSQSSGALRQYIEAAGDTLPEKLKDAYLSSLNATKRLKVMTNSSLPSHKICFPGAVFVGDAYNMRHPLTGAGMTVGLWDVFYLSTNLSPKNLKNLSDYSLQLGAVNKAYNQRRSRALVLNVMSVALYSLFAADSEPYRNLRDACFQYFEFGGDAIDGPSGLLSGTITNPIVLAYHFFAVAIYAMFLEISKANSLFMIIPHVYKSVYTLVVAAYIFVPLILEEILPN
ncbi:hypothetical protein BB561_001790 [Smittium simulii]|uniref:Squalene monooxygenase n=1 Tax=Smittium simulii TaxID=133385 RepID=A0A2T9YT17_9FUNG|nr:hypothetical protein BB561_001790 [Smittium simulii]